MAISINEKRLWDTLMEHGQIGGTDKGGVCRLALTDLDRQGRDKFVEWCKEANLTIRVDEIGNIFARRAGTDPTRKAIAMGSHIDTQPTGGKFDGIYGVMSGLEVLRTLNDHHIQTKAPIEVIVWTNEEGSRYVPVMMGSGVFAGEFTLEHALAAVDEHGVSVKDELQKIGYAGGVKPGDVPGGLFDAYFEAHIEQGPVLENNQLPVGVVVGALGQRWYDVVITGMESHAGTTPMELRHDALLAASRMVEKVNEVALSYAPYGRGTVGYMKVMPNSRNTIPGTVNFTIDIRALHDEELLAMQETLMNYAKSLEAKDSRLKITIKQVVYYPPCHFTQKCVESVRESATELDYAHMDIVSGAGHDAVYMANILPSAMIFVPCKDGISHNEVEDADPKHLAAGANVLLHTILKHAN